MVALLWIYSFLPDRVGYLANQYGMPDEFMERSTFFYSSLSAFLLTNGLIYALHKLLLITRRTAQTEYTISLRRDLAGWLLGFGAALNLFFVMTMAFFGLMNSRENFNINDYALLVWGGPMLLALMFGVLVYILIKNRR
jgi:uncharacterized membrane protein